MTMAKGQGSTWSGADVILDLMRELFNNCDGDANWYST